ncbi:endonuclease domain-containing protein [Bacteroidota bacterium]
MNRKKILPYNPKLKKVARMLRKNMTLSEILLWKEIKGKQISGYDFDRQRPIDNYIVDFYCKDLVLAIEIDGDSHIDKEVKVNDVTRQKRLEDLGVRFLRFDDMDVKDNIDAVLQDIKNWIENNESTPTAPGRGLSEL